jgi:hypothetical protein
VIRPSQIRNSIAIAVIAYALYLLYQSRSYAGAPDAGLLLLPLYFLLPVVLLTYVTLSKQSGAHVPSKTNKRLNQITGIIVLFVALLVLGLFAIPLGIAFPGLGLVFIFTGLAGATVYLYIRFRTWRKVILITAAATTITLLAAGSIYLQNLNRAARKSTNDYAARQNFIVPEPQALKLIQDCKVIDIIVNRDILQLLLTNDIVYFNQPGGYVKAPLAMRANLEKAFHESACPKG